MKYNIYKIEPLVCYMWLQHEKQMGNVKIVASIFYTVYGFISAASSYQQRSPIFHNFLLHLKKSLHLSTLALYLKSYNWV